LKTRTGRERIAGVLVGRRAERAQIRSLLAAARRGQSGALVLVGEAGVGKTALLEDAASARGLRVLRARGVEAEAELPYAGLHTLLRPVLGLVPALPPPQREALGAALALDAARPAEPLAVCAATLVLLAAAAEDEPLLVLVDDAQWLDAESARAVGFAARRLADEGVAMLLAVRADEASSIATDDLEALPLAGLDAHDATELLGDGVPATVARRLAAATNGNPLALLELGRGLTPAQLRGAEPVGEPVAAGTAVQRAFGRRLDALPPGARALVLVAAAAGQRDDVATLLAAAGRLGSSRDDLAAAERATVLHVEDGRVAFRHPLVRAAAYAGAAPPDLRAAHAAVAAELDGEAHPDEQAWHLALAAAGHDEEAAAAIEAAGLRALGRSRSAAQRALTRAAALSPPGPDRTRRLLAAAEAATAAGAWADAAALLDDVGDASGRAAAELLHLRGLTAAKTGRGAEAALLLEQAAAGLAAFDPERAARAEVQAAETWTEVLEPERAYAAARRAAALPVEVSGTTAAAVALALGDTAGWLGRIEDAVGSWRQAAELADADEPEALQLQAEALFSAGDDVAALRVLERAESLARERTALGVLTIVLELRALSATRAGDLVQAHAAAAEAAELMQAIGQRAELAKALGALAWIDAMLGQEADCRLHTERALRVLHDLGQRPAGASGLGLLELSLGRADLAVAQFEPVMDVRSIRLDVEVIAPRLVLPAFVESLARSGRREDAAAALGDGVAIARGTGRPHAVAPLLRCQGILDADEAAFVEALEWHERWGNRFERARTELCHGELLRRSKRRADARERLRAALEGFEAVGARLWAEGARAELRATGERARRRDPSTVDDLTPQELQVARLVATGLTNREVAARLFLSPKTIETHLGRVFRKTGVRTRTELSHRFRDLPDSMRARPT
jgi:DNA-binding CsgD family transcriptional regulator